MELYFSPNPEKICAQRGGCRPSYHYRRDTIPRKTPSNEDTPILILVGRGVVVTGSRLRIRGDEVWAVWGWVAAEIFEQFLWSGDGADCRS